MNPAVSFPIPLMIITLVEVVAATGLVFLLVPRLIFPRIAVDHRDEWMIRVALMMVWVMGFGYLLSLIHLFTAIAWVVLMAATAWLLRRQKNSRYVLGAEGQVSATIYDSLSNQKAWRDRWRGWLRGVIPRRQRKSRGMLFYLFGGATLLIMGIAAWMRFDANWHHAALFFSDAYETVSWVKGIAHGVLFPNGIYPQGYYLVTATLETLAHANAVVFIKFFGALVGTLLTGSVMWSTYRFSGRVVPALVAGALYGIVPALFPDTAVRQIAAEGQELGNLLVLPIAWLVFQAWVTKKPGYVLGASAAMAAVALTHPIALFNAVLAAFAATFGGWAVAGVSLPMLKRFAWMIPSAAILAVLPLGIGIAMGRPLLASGVTFLTESATVAARQSSAIMPPISFMVWVSLAAIACLFVTKLLWYDELWEMGLPATLFLLLVFAEAVVQLPRVGISFAPLVTRAGEFLALVESLSVGLGVAGLQEAVERLGVDQPRAALGTFLASLLAVGYIVEKHPPRPLIAYTMNSDTYVAELVHLGTALPKFSWDAVAYNAYALAVYQGYQYNPSVWASHVSPRYHWPHWKDAGSAPFAMSQPNIFFFVSRHQELGHVPGRTQILKQDQIQNADLIHWIRAWEKVHGSMPIYFHNSQMTVYELVNHSES